ncbi:MAG: NAD-dependent epimerase/dehydratase family protein [Acidimicrobiales bacterium]
MVPDPVATVVGASGFIGNSLVGRFATLGVPIESFTRERPFPPVPDELGPDATLPRTVFWLATNVNPAVAEERPDLVDLDQCTFEAALRAIEGSDRPPRVVLLSSGGTVYDTTFPPPYDETSPVSATTAYARSKLALERALYSSSLPPERRVVVRVANAYGPGQQARRGQGVVAHWLQAAADGRPLVLIGDKESVRDYVYIDDIVDALVAIHRVDGALPPVLNVGSGHGTSLAELADTVLEVVGDRALTIDARPARGFDVSRTWLDSRLAERALGWRPRTSLREGVAATWRAFTS